MRRRESGKTNLLLRLAQYWREARIISDKLERTAVGDPGRKERRQRRLSELKEKLIPGAKKEIEDNIENDLEEILNRKK